MAFFHISIFFIINDIDYKWKKSKFLFSLIIFYTEFYSILIESKHSHKYKIIAISYADYKYVRQLKDMLI